MFKKSILVLITIAAMVFFSGCGGSIYDNIDNNSTTPANNQVKGESIDANELVGSGHGRGPQNAKVTIVEFSDFECPACAAIHPRVKEVLEKYPDNVRLVYRHFPLSYHQNARPASYAFEAAAKQGKPWEMFDLIFENNTKLNSETYLQFAKQLNLNIDQFKSDMALDDIKKIVDDDYNYGVKLNLKGTPTFYINATEFTGDPTVSGFSQIIDEILKAQ